MGSRYTMAGGDIAQYLYILPTRTIGNWNKKVNEDIQSKHNMDV